MKTEMLTLGYGIFAGDRVRVGPPLTEKQLRKVKTGEKLAIKWSGGNGPWVYEIENIKGEVYSIGRRGGIGKGARAIIRRNRIRFVGEREPFTVVRKVYGRIHRKSTKSISSKRSDQSN